MAVDGSLKFDTKVDTAGFAKGTNTIKGQANGLKKSLAGIGKMVTAAFGVAQLIKFGKQAVETASDLQEVQNVVDTAFGDMSYKMEEFADKSIEAFGISKLAAKQTGSIYMAMGTGMGLATDNASDMAVALTGLSADMASFYNVSQDVASTALKSIYTGETETLKQFGIVMTEANLQSFALSEGIKKSVSNMSQAEKVQLRYAFVVKQAALAQGDFARTSDSWANQTRMLSEKWKEFLGILGTGLAQVLTPVVQYLNTAMTYLIKFATQVGSILSNVFGVEKTTSATAKAAADVGANTESASSGLNEFGEAVEEASKKASGTAGFDKLNIMTESIAENSTGAADALMSMGGVNTAVSATVGPADTSALESSLSASIERIKEGFTQFTSWISTNFVPIFSGIWTGLQPHIETFKTIVSGIWTDIQTLWQPFLDFVGGYFTPLLQEYFTTAGTIVTGLFDTFSKVFSDIWNIAILPMLQNIITVALPMLASFGTEFYSLFGVVFEEVKKIFDMLWNDVAAPALELFAKVWTDLSVIMSDFWNKWGKPIFDKLKEAWKKASEIFKKYWESYLKPVWDTFMRVVDKLWTEHLKPLIANFMDFVGTLVDGALKIYNKVIAPIIMWIVEKFGPPVSKVFSRLIEIFGEFYGGIYDAVNNTITVLKDIVNFIVDVFTGDWEGAWTDVKKIFKDTWDAFVDVVKVPVNLIIDIVNGMVAGIVAGVNTIIKAINSINFEVPDWVPGVGGNSIGFSLQPITAPKIPKLATGTVVPANYGEFLAKLGDNKREPEIVSPLSTMKQAVAEALAESGVGREIVLRLIMSGDMAALARLMKPALEAEDKRIGMRMVVSGGRA